MRAGPAGEMGGWRVLSGAPRGLRRVGDAGFGTAARSRLQPRGSRAPGDQPFPGLWRPEGLGPEALVGVLKEAVVDQKGPLVTLNKPQGLPVAGREGELTLLSVLPELSQSLGLHQQGRELQIVHAPGKEASGLVLLSSCPQTASRLQKFFVHSRRAQRPTATYCAVTQGVPAASEGKIQAVLTLEHAGAQVQQGKASLQAVPVKSPSRKAIRDGARRTLSHFRVVAEGSGCALVQLQPLTVFPGQLQVHLMMQLCPVLGDHTYAPRVGSVLGQRFLLPAPSTKPQRQVLDGGLLRRLRLTPAQAAQLPLHLHLHRLLLPVPGARPRDAPSELLVPLPPYFSRTLQCLGLSQPRSSVPP